MKKCTRCGVEKSDVDFYQDKFRRDGLSCRCKECIRRQAHAYQSTDRGKQKRKEWLRSPEVKERLRARSKTPEARERRRKYRLRPDVQAKELKYRLAYQERPDVRARWKDYYRSQKHREASRKYCKSEKGLQRYREYRRAHFEKAHAREMLNKAISRGKIIVGTCALQSDSCFGKIHGHHHNGYEPPHWYDVTWLCARHHRMLHEGQIFPT